MKLAQEIFLKYKDFNESANRGEMLEKFKDLDRLLGQSETNRPVELPKFLLEIPANPSKQQILTELQAILEEESLKANFNN